MFGGHRNFRCLLTENLEGIVSNILTDRLKRLTANGLLSRSRDASHKQRIFYSLTDKAIDLVPLMAIMGSWGPRHMRSSIETATRARVLEDGGPPLWSEFMAELRHLHLGAPPPGVSALAQMQAAFEAATAVKARSQDVVQPSS